MLRAFASTALVFVAALAVGACGGDDDASPVSPSADGGPIRVATTLPLFADFVRAVGGDRVDVFAVLPSGADPHTYEPTPSDIRRIAEADLIFVNGLEPTLEGPILDVIESNKDGDAQLVAFMDRVTTADTDSGDNPHLWLSPTFASAYAGVIEGILREADLSGADGYSANLARYADDLSALDRELADRIDRIPSHNRRLVTTHDAFPHFARQYGLKIAGFIVPGPGQDPSPGDIADLTEAIRDLDVPAVFAEPQIGSDSRLLERVADDAGVPVCTLYSDTLDDDVPTYVDMMRFNAGELARCLGGDDG